MRLRDGGGAFSPETRALIIARAGGMCEKCAMPLATGAQLHHRKPRGMGGTSDSEIGGPQNGLIVHAFCHRKIESNREEAIAMGWLISGRQSPLSTPVYRFGRWSFLLASGSVRDVDEPFASRLSRKRLGHLDSR